MQDDLPHGADNKSAQSNRTARIRQTYGRCAAFGAVLLAGTAFAVPVQADAGKSSFLLIDGGAPSGQARLTGCDRATSDLHAALDKAGQANTVLIAPTAGAMRDALLRFGQADSDVPHVLAFCGYAAETGGNIFALGSDFSTRDDPALTAVSIRAFSRVAGDAKGLVLLDLHPTVIDGAPVAAAAGALQGAAEAWREDNSLTGTRIAATDRQPGDATLLGKASHASSMNADAISAAAGQPQPAPAVTPPPSPPTSTQPVPASEPQRTPDKPQVATSQSAPVPPPPDHAAGDTAPDHAAVDHAESSDTAKPADASQHSPTTADSVGAATPLAPPATPAPPRPHVHVDPAVRKIQVSLLARGLFTGRINGVNTPDTQRGIKHFQAMLGHPVTGTLTADETKQLTGG